MYFARRMVLEHLALAQDNRFLGWEVVQREAQLHP